MSTRYATHHNKRQTPQNQPIPGTKQAKNNAGGYVYEIDKWSRLQRFLILGSDGGTYYVKERELTRDNAAVVEACLAEDAERTVAFIVTISDAGRAPKNDPAIFALALAASVQNPDATGLSSASIRAMALDQLPKVCRIPTHLFHFVEFVKGLRGFGRALNRALTEWYDRWDANQLAFEVLKYQSRDGWSHKDVFRKAHPKLGPDKQAVLRWAVGADMGIRYVTRKLTNGQKAAKSYDAAGELPSIIAAYEELKAAYSTTEVRSRAAGADAAFAVQLIEQHGLTREMLPTQALNDLKVWEALLPKMGMTALVRNLAKMTAVGLLTPLSDTERTIKDRLRNPEYLRKGRIHPLAVLNALRVYSAGRGDKGKLTWTPVQGVVDALNDAFYLTFGNVTVTGKNLMLALDVSGSMCAPIADTGLSCREACAALALVTANVEPNHVIVGFTNGGSVSSRSQWMGFQSGITPLKISPKQRLDDVVKYTSGLQFGGTDCALPMIYGTKQKLDVDAFCVYTDSETWAGDIHPSQALVKYRQAQSKPDAKCVVVGMTATGFSIADPKDPRMLDVVGFDLATPEAISGFVAE